jgi:transcriptional regulator with XRE-family HTH domain
MKEKSKTDRWSYTTNRLNHSERLRRSLKRAGISESALRESTGLSEETIDDILYDDHEFCMYISIYQALMVSKVLGIDPLEIVCEIPCQRSQNNQISFNELMSKVREYIGQSKMSLHEFEDYAGWDISEALADPELMWGYNLDALRDICTAADIDWIDAIPS